jgi:DNA-binding winged helix-turn-helix (wHTH) protein
MRVRFADFSLDSPARELRRGGQVVHLSPKAFELLVLLAEATPRALSKSEILDAVWPGTFVVDSSLASVVKELRAALDDDAKEPRFVRTVYGYGYAFSAEAITPQQSGSPACRLIWGAREIALQAGSNILGRAGNAVAWIDHPSVSRHHAVIALDGSEATIEDLQSKNGTLVQGVRVRRRQRLNDGDLIVLGRVPMIFRLYQAGTPTESGVSPSIGSDQDLRGNGYEVRARRDPHPRRRERR